MQRNPTLASEIVGLRCANPTYLFIDARLGDAHAFARELVGPFDLVFLDADKDGYFAYWTALRPKLAVSSSFVADNVLRSGSREVTRMMTAVQGDPAFKTHIEDLGSGEGLLIACR